MLGDICMENIYSKIKDLADKYKKNLSKKVDERVAEIETDDNSH